MRINYFSDIHLEFGPLEVPENEADVIIAAGDIGIYNQGLEWLKKTRKPVIYVAGNHELYSNEYLDTMKFIRGKCAGSRVHFLENNIFVYNGIFYQFMSLNIIRYIKKAKGDNRTSHDSNNVNKEIII